MKKLGKQAFIPLLLVLELTKKKSYNLTFKIKTTKIYELPPFNSILQRLEGFRSTA